MNENTKSNDRLSSHVEWLRGDHLNCNPWLANDIEALLDNLTQEMFQREKLENTVREMDYWLSQLAECLMVMNAQHGGKNAARLLKDYRDFRASLQKDTDNG